MKENPPALPFTERQVVRRGLLAGLAGLGAAAVVKLTGAAKAEAAASATLVGASTAAYGLLAVSYTHLTLPTILRV